MFEINGEFGKLFESTKKCSERFGRVVESTRSRVGIQKSDGSIESIYVHHDGYPSGVGKTLKNYYTDEGKIQELMNLGDISSLGPEIGTAHDFNNPPENEVNAYGRDRGETRVESEISNSEEEFKTLAGKTDADYTYLFKDGHWIVLDVYGDPVENE